ncbi:MAG: AAA family ATPase [Patescibacteria group bacterium]
MPEVTKVVYIMRGVPGSGKTTIARMLAGTTGRIHSTDDFFIGADGKYCFNPRELEGNHRRNFEAFCRSLDEGVPAVICDNTNVRRWQFEPHVRAARQRGYLMAIVAMPHPTVDEAVRRNTHGVPAGAIQGMLCEWEP